MKTAASNQTSDPLQRLETNSFPVKIVRTITVPTLNILPKSLIQFFMKNSSKDAGTVVAKGGTTHALEAMYGRSERKLFSRGITQGIADILWHHLISQPRSLRNRLRIVQGVIQEKIQLLLKDSSHTEVNVLSIAGGSSRSIMYALQNLKKRGLTEQIHIITIDKDITALDVGKRIAKELGLEDNFEWVHGTASEVHGLFPSRKFDIVEIVGLLDYFDFDRATRLISMTRDLLNEGGFIVIANVIPNREQPFVYKTGWPSMFYRKPKDVRRMLETSGFTSSNDIIVEPLKIHCVGVGQK